jgi:hypothetical protein
MDFLARQMADRHIMYVARFIFLAAAFHLPRFPFLLQEEVIAPEASGPRLPTFQEKV